MKVDWLLTFATMLGNNPLQRQGNGGSEVKAIGRSEARFTASSALGTLL